MQNTLSHEILTSLDLLREGVSVHLTDTGGGRDFVRKEALTRLERQGTKVYTFQCFATLSQEPLAALKLSDLWSAASLTETASVVQAILRCSEVIASSHHVIISVSNLDQIDPQTWAVLETLHSRTGARLFTTGERVTRSRRERRHVLADIAWPSKEIVIDNLDFVAVNSLIEHRLGHQAHHDLVGEIYVETQGHYDLVILLIDSAQRANRIELQDGHWRPCGDLWNPLLREYLEAYLEARPQYVRDLLEATAVLGAIPLGGERQLLSEESLQILEEEGLVSTFVQGTELVMQVDP